MPETERLFQLLKKDDVNNHKIRKLLKENVIGTPGKSLVYQHQYVDQKLDHITKPHFISIGKGDSILGACCFCERTVRVSHKSIKAFYIRYFTFRKGLRDNSENTGRPKSTIRSEVLRLLDGQLTDAPDCTIHYAYIDPNNLRSLQKAEQFGFHHTGSFRTVFLSRINPKPSKNVSLIKSADKNQVEFNLTTFYHSFQLFSLENIFYQNNYYVYKENGDIKAGIQANPEFWKVYELPGKGGKFLIKIISQIPIVRKIFGGNFRFLSLEGVFFQPGYEFALEELIETALYQSRLKSAVICLDKSTTLYQVFQQLKGGILRKISNEKEFSVMVRSNTGEDNTDKGMAVYVSAFDVM